MLSRLLMKKYVFKHKKCKISIFCGNAYLKAVELERKHEWIGVAIDKSIEENFSDFFNKLIQNNGIITLHHSPSIVKYKVPLKENKKERSAELLYTVNWLDKLYLFNDKGQHISHEQIIVSAL